MLNEPTKTALLKLARDAVEAAVRGKRPPSPDPSLTILMEKRGAFVTLKKHGDLRGCIGYPEPVKLLSEALLDSAASAALNDPRFPPVRPEELPDLHLEVSVLTKPEPLAAEDVEVGKHGLIVQRGFSRGLLLPQVATEWGWDRETFLEHTCRKAGLPKDAWRKGAEILAFSAEVFGEEEGAGGSGESR